ncbi:hypothetical protein JKF63_05470 [Porcisia hertigi]|uniref:Uncharacterized protein n=1 Tax=Porcisia hertigi TaxID=2761500 RepID=A0A836IA50_9TRYP|nr:hypothetical protein JKF63_05470 [Porcisia hertigi]
MWKKTLCRLWLTRSPLCLRGTPHAVGEDKRKGNSHGSAPRTGGAANVSSPAVEPTPTVAASSASPALASSPPSSTLLTVTHAVDQLRELTRRTQHTLRTQEETMQLLQQELSLLARRLAHLESTADGLHGKLNEVHRAMGEVVLGQRNTDLLVQQMERRQLGECSDKVATSGSGEGETAALSTVFPYSDRCAPSFSSGDGGASHVDVSPTTTTVAPVTSPSNAQLAEQVSTLQARLDQLTTNLFAADRCGTVVGHMAASGIDTEKVAASLLPAENPLSRASLLQQLQRRYALSIFTDAAGVTRLSSQVVRVHNVPLNMGAMEVRELCVQHVCKGNNAHELVSCMVHRSSDSIPAAATADGQTSQPVHEGAGPPNAATPSRYLSRELASKCASQLPASTADAALGALPRGDTVATIRPNTKTLEVVFTSTAAAVRALQVLNGMHLRPTIHDTPLPLVVEPVISADVLAALKAWEDEATTSTPLIRCSK